MDGQFTVRICALDWCHEPIQSKERVVLSHVEHIHDGCAYTFEVEGVEKEEFGCYAPKWCDDKDSTRAAWIHRGSCPSESGWKVDLAYISVAAALVVGQVSEWWWPGNDYPATILVLTIMALGIVRLKMFLVERRAAKQDDGMESEGG